MFTVNNLLLLMLGLNVLNLSSGFPDGAPADTCVKKRLNEPNHGAARSQSHETLPYQVVASSDSYQPGQQIIVQVSATSAQDPFRGFFLQARDVDTKKWIGEWEESPHTKTIPECSSITHADPMDKIAATFIWKAPQDKAGRVYFTGTIVKDYGTFWSNIQALVEAPQYQQQQQQQQEQQEQQPPYRWQQQYQQQYQQK